MGEWHHPPAGQSGALETYPEVSKYRSSLDIEIEKEIKLCSTIRDPDCLPSSIRLFFFSLSQSDLPSSLDIKIDGCDQRQLVQQAEMVSPSLVKGRLAPSKRTQQYRSCFVSRGDQRQSSNWN